MALNRIILIDDDDDLRESLELLLTSLGYRVQAFARADLALAELRLGLPTCVVLLDLMMPGMSGWAFRAQQRADPTIAHIPVVVVTARTSLDAPGEPPLDHVELLRKPSPPDELLAVIDQHCARHAT